MNKKFYIGICTLVLTVLLATLTSQAAIRTVINLNNAGAGSLRQTVIDATAGDKIVFAAGLKGSIQLSSPILLDKNLIINGPGANILGVEGRSQPTESRVFNLDTSTVTISDLRISRGFSSGGGGGVTIESGGNLTLNNCLITGNDAESGGGVIVPNGATLTITNSTIAGNTAASEGGGISNRGTLFLTNSTIIGNDASSGAGVANQGFATATILNCTITNNGSPSTAIGGVSSFLSTVNLKNTIVAKNRNASFPQAQFGIMADDIGGIINSQGNNLIGNRTGGSGFIASDLPEGDPMFGGFANNGGATYTVSLLPGSPAINTGTNIGAPATDQRGVARPLGGTVDIGAYESGIIPAAFGKIAFVGIVGANREIFSMNSDASNQLNLTNNAARDDAPKWSPDGSKIVFVTDRDGGFLEIYTMDADGSNPTRLTNNSVADENPVWSPDGTKIAFDRNGQIFSMDANGTNVIQLTNSSFTGIKAHPSWSWDGKLIVFHNNRGFGDFRVQFIPSSCVSCTGGQTYINDRLPDNFNPIWSPDSNSIAFSNDQLDFTDHSDPHTFMFSPFLNNLGFPSRPLVAANNPRLISPAWSPDGTKFVYQTNVNGLSTINADGTNPTVLGVVGLLPDWFGFNTTSGTNITAVSGTTTVNFLAVTTPGTTSVVPIDPASAGTLPGGYSLGVGFPAYEITTTAVYTAPITVCLHVPSVTNMAIFNALTIFHSEGSPLALVPKPTSHNFSARMICASVNSLSPFVVAENIAPTAANVSVSGRVLTFSGAGIPRVQVLITNQNGETRAATTNSFGNYRFNDIPAGETYVLSIRHKVYQFNSRVITVSEDIQNADFTADRNY